MTKSQCLLAKACISPHGDAILKKLKIWLNACIILLLLLYLTGVNFSANLKLKGKILA
jgi:hypothetical protein